jgi:hypothetical protein
VYLFDRRSGGEVALASAMPLPRLDAWHGNLRSFHIDPHPHFSPDSRYVVYTGTPLGRIDVVLASVESALARLTPRGDATDE